MEELELTKYYSKEGSSRRKWEERNPEKFKIWLEERLEFLELERVHKAQQRYLAKLLGKTPTVEPPRELSRAEKNALKIRGRIERAGLQYKKYDSLNCVEKSIIREVFGPCSLCGSSHMLAVDHCHTTGLVRGVLCNRCNVGLGMLGDESPNVLKAHSS